MKIAIDHHIILIIKPGYIRIEKEFKEGVLTEEIESGDKWFAKINDLISGLSFIVEDIMETHPGYRHMKEIAKERYKQEGR